MPAITASLSEVGYEGYVSIPKGQRSKVIDRMLRDYALKRTHVRLSPFEGQISVQEVLERQQFMGISMETQLEEIRMLKEENKKLRGEEE
jgi:hypothetical protein